MKKFLFAAALSIMVLPASAQAATQAEAIETCGGFGNAAKEVMTSRQEGVPMSQLLGIVPDNDLYVSLVQDAYKRQRWHTAESKVREIEDFRVYAEDVCFEFLLD